MKSMLTKFCMTCFFVMSLSPLTASAQDTAQDDKKIESKPFKLADDSIQMDAPTAWKTQKPRFNMIEAEFKIMKAEGDAKDGRLTIMQSGGSIEANIDRWVGQFQQPDGSSTKEKTKVKKETIAECPVHMVDISGTFLESSGGPFGPKTERENYRMLAAIIETEGQGNYFVKLYGPSKTIKANEKGFKQMVKSLKFVKN